MHLSARGGGGRDEGLAETEHEVSLGEPQSPERKVTRPNIISACLPTTFSCLKTEQPSAFGTTQSNEEIS